MAYWIGVIFFAYQTAYALVAGLSIDAWQLKYVAEVVAKVAFFFLLYELLRRQQAIICLVLLLLLSDYKYPIENVAVEGDYDVALEKKIAAIADGEPLKGLFVDENMALPEEPYLFYYPTHATDYARATDFRLYLFHYDVTGFRSSIPVLKPAAQPILVSAIQPLFDTEVPILETLKKHNMPLVWVHKESKYLNAFAHLKPLHELEGYFVYYLNW